MFARFKKILLDALRWSEYYLRTDMVYLARGGFWLVIGRAITMAGGLLTVVAFANLVPKEVYGTYQFIMSMTAVVSSFTLVGMNSAITRAVARGSEGALRAGFRTQLKWSTGMVFAAAALALYYYLNGNYTLATSFIIVGAFAPFLTGFGLTQSYFIGKRMFRESALFGIGRRLIPIAAILATLALSQEPVVIVAAYFISNTLSAGLLYRMVLTRYHLPKTDESDMVRYGKHLSFLKIFSEITAQADKVLVWALLGAAPMAAYTIATLPVKQIEGMFKLLYPLTFPKMIEAKFSDLKETLARKVRISLLGAAVVAGLYILAAPFLFSLLFPAYPESVLLSQLLALTILAKPRSLYGQVFVAHHMKRELYITNLSGSALNIILLLALLPQYGIWGAAYAVLTTHLFTNAITRYLFYTAKH